jgi:hypothetical protein
MRKLGYAGVAVVAIALLSVGACATTSETDDKIDQAMSFDGLAKTSIKGIDLAYVRPGASIAGYSSIQLDPVSVAFHKDWDPDVPGSRLKISSNDREEVRQRMATLVHDAFVKELETKGGYPISATPGPAVLRVKLNIVNLDVTAPDVGSSTMSRTYVVSAGSATLFAEFFDSESGQLIARVIDSEEAREYGTMTLSSSVANMSEGRAMASGWARIFRNRLDAVRSQAASGAPAP